MASVSVVFSPDGQWLGVGGLSQCIFYKSGSWKASRVVAYAVPETPILTAFHPGSRVAAFGSSVRSMIQLVEVETGHTLASVEGTDKSALHCLVFSPDGRYLTTSHTDQRVNLWDLRLIRRQLQELNLATGFPDIFEGGIARGNLPTIDRIEVAGDVAH
jgi:WD40 repeat protein